MATFDVTTLQSSVIECKEDEARPVGSSAELDVGGDKSFVPFEFAEVPGEGSTDEVGGVGERKCHAIILSNICRH